MRLLTFFKDSRESVGVVCDDGLRVLCLPSAAQHYAMPGIPLTMLDIVRQNEQSVPAIRKLLAQAQADSSCLSFLLLEGLNILAPYKNPPRNVLCVGLNYYAHILEFEQAGGSVPTSPIFFTKPFTALADPDTAVDAHTAETSRYDYETELAVVIGKSGKNIPREKAYEHVFGYSILNDMSARDVQTRTSQWYSGKCLDESAPWGPYLVHKDSVGNPHNLDILCLINGEERQKSNTSLMIFDIPTIISTFSQGTTLLAGDIIATGTCPGVGMGMNPPTFLKPGDSMEMTIERVGTLRNTLR